MKKKKILIIEIVVLIVFVAILIGAFTKKSSDSSADNTVAALEKEETVECIELETPYVTLKFPEEYTDRIRMETVEEDVYKVEFHGTLRSKKEVHLSDIAFGGNEGNPVGFLTVGEDTVPVNMIYHDQEEDWTEDEMIEIQDMQRAVEFVMDELVETEGFDR